MGILVGKAIKFRLFFRRDEASFVFKHKVGTANDHSVLPYGTGNAMGHQVIHLRVHFFMGKAPVSGGLDHGIGHGVGKVLLQASSQTEHIGLIVSPKRNDCDYGRAGPG